MEIANLLRTYDGRTYYLNTLEEETIIKFCESNEWFDGYDTMIKKCYADIGSVKKYTNPWFTYVNRNMDNTDFSTDILAFIANNEEELDDLKSATGHTVDAKLTDFILVQNLYTLIKFTLLQMNGIQQAVHMTDILFID